MRPAQWELILTLIIQIREKYKATCTTITDFYLQNTKLCYSLLWIIRKIRSFLRNLHRPKHFNLLLNSFLTHFNYGLLVIFLSSCEDINLLSFFLDFLSFTSFTTFTTFIVSLTLTLILIHFLNRFFILSFFLFTIQVNFY